MRIATTGIAPNPNARSPRSVITDPSARPLRCTHSTEMVNGRKDQYDPERADHDLGDQWEHRPRQFGRRAANDRDRPEHARRVPATPIRPIARLGCDEAESPDDVPGDVEVLRDRLARTDAP